VGVSFRNRILILKLLTRFLDYTRAALLFGMFLTNSCCFAILGDTQEKVKSDIGEKDSFGTYSHKGMSLRINFQGGLVNTVTYFGDGKSPFPTDKIQEFLNENAEPGQMWSPLGDGDSNWVWIRTDNNATGTYDIYSDTLQVATGPYSESPPRAYFTGKSGQYAAGVIGAWQKGLDATREAYLKAEYSESTIKPQQIVDLYTHGDKVGLASTLAQIGDKQDKLWILSLLEIVGAQSGDFDGALKFYDQRYSLAGNQACDDCDWTLELLLQKNRKLATAEDFVGDQRMGCFCGRNPALALEYIASGFVRGADSGEAYKARLARLSQVESGATSSERLALVDAYKAVHAMIVGAALYFETHQSTADLEGLESALRTITLPADSGTALYSALGKRALISRLIDQIHQATTKKAK
jgi:hypothetical protein